MYDINDVKGQGQKAECRTGCSGDILSVGSFLEVASMVVTWWIVAFFDTFTSEMNHRVSLKCFQPTIKIINVLIALSSQKRPGFSCTFKQLGPREWW